MRFARMSFLIEPSSFQAQVLYFEKSFVLSQSAVVCKVEQAATATRPRTASAVRTLFIGASFRRTSATIAGRDPASRPNPFARLSAAPRPLEQRLHVLLPRLQLEGLLPERHRAIAVVTDLVEQQSENVAGQGRRLCGNRLFVGADGLLHLR